MNKQETNGLAIEAKGLVKGFNGMIVGTDLQVYFGAANLPEFRQDMFHHRTGDAFAPMRRSHAHCIEPSPMAVIAGHAGADQLPLILHDKYQVIHGQFLRNKPGGLIVRRAVGEN